MEGYCNYPKSTFVHILEAIMAYFVTHRADIEQ